MLRFSVQRGVSIAFAAGLAGLTIACAAIDSVGQRGGAMDESVARYRNEETLRNIVRASKDEPLNFSAISSVTGHNTVTLGAPALTWTAPTRAPSEAIGSTAANTAAYNFSNDFAWNQIDDNATTSALLTPLDASTMAIFFEYGYPPDLLLLLFVHHIQIRENIKGKDGGPGTPGRVLHIYYSNKIADPGGEATLAAYTYLADYQGLTFRFERASIPGQQKKPRSQICFDPDTARAVGNINKIDSMEPGTRPYHNGHLTTLLNAFPTFDRVPGLGVLKTPPIDVLAIANCNQPASWIPVPTDSAATNINENYNCISSVCTAKTKSSPGPEAAYRVYDRYDDVWLELFTRSTNSIYLFLGGLIDTNVKLLLGGFDESFFTVTTGASDDCFTEIFFQEHYCVPQKANDTKKIFDMLHQLAALYTFPSTAPANSSTVRITP
jgi:hypothetical protein